MEKPLRLLNVEDSEDDALLVLRHLRREGYEPQSERVDMPGPLSAALDHSAWDIVICDRNLPDLDPFVVLTELRNRGLDVPVLVVSGAVGEGDLVELMRAGARDVILKNNLARLGPAIERELREADGRAARLRAENTLRDALESMSQGFALYDFDDRLVVCNEVYRQLADESSEFLVPGARYEDIVRQGVRAGHHPEAEGRIEDWVAGRIAQHREAQSGVEKNLPDGRWVLTNKHGAGVGGIVDILTDITESKVVGEQLLQAQKMEAVGELTGGLAHDFNNLLAVVLGNLQLVERTVQGEEKTAKRVKAAIDAVEKGALLTRRMLAFSRRQQLETESIDPNALIEGFGDLLISTLGGAVAVECRLGRNIPPVQVDLNQLEAALLNLAVNARDAMPEGGTFTIETGVVNLDEDHAAWQSDLVSGDYVVLTVTDSGEGIPPEVIERIFEPFFTTKDVGKGSGLGLSMVYGFIKQSGGQVQICSAIGAGTTVHMYLPVDDAAVGLGPGEGLDSKVEPAAASEPGSDTGRRETILIVEDQEEVRETAVEILEDLGYLVVEADNGRNGLAMVESRSEIDLIFTDIVMPGGMDGTQLAEAAGKLRPELPVLFATGFADAAVLRDGHASTATNLIGKPYRREDLAAKIRLMLTDGKSPDSGVVAAA